MEQYSGKVNVRSHKHCVSAKCECSFNHLLVSQIFKLNCVQGSHFQLLQSKDVRDINQVVLCTTGMMISPLSCKVTRVSRTSQYNPLVFTSTHALLIWGSTKNSFETTSQQALQRSFIGMKGHLPCTGSDNPHTEWTGWKSRLCCRSNRRSTSRLLRPRRRSRQKRPTTSSVAPSSARISKQE